MKPTVKAPGLDDRRTEAFSAELQERARAWIPSWGLADGERDFGRALLAVAARFSSEVAERLDRAGEKMQRGFLDWLAVRGRAAPPARMPVVFQLAESATEAVLADAPIRMQVDAGGASVIFETEKDVRLVPGRVATVIGVDADEDAVYLSPPGLSDLEPLEPLPTQWQLKSFAAVDAKTLQVDPETGLKAGMVVEAGDQQYRVEKADGEIITIDPPLTSELSPDTTVLRKVTTFAPFDGKTRNRQEHALYLGHGELLDIESAATIHIVGAQSLSEDLRWEYWGKTKGDEEADWRQLTPAETQDGDALALDKPEGSIELRDIDGKNSRWIRGVTKNLIATDQPFQLSSLAIRVNAVGCKGVKCADEKGPSPAAEGMANTTPLVLENTFLPLGREPRLFDAFYVGSVEAFSKKGASVQLCFEIADPSFSSLSRVRSGALPNFLAGVGADHKLHLLRFDAAGPKLEKFLDREGLQPPVPQIGAQPTNTVPLALDAKPPWRVPMWNELFDFFVGVTAKADVWVWKEIAGDKNGSGWMPFGPVPAATATSTALIDGLVYFEDTKRLAALRNGVLSIRDFPSGAQWNDVPTTDPTNGNATVVLKSIAPVLVNNGFNQLVTSEAQGLVGVTSAGELFHVDTASGDCKQLLANVDPEIRPAAVFDGTKLMAVAFDKITPQLVAFSEPSQTKFAPLEAQAIVRGPLDAVLLNGDIHFLASVTAASSDDAYFAMWAPFATAPDDHLFKTSVPSGSGEIGGAPTLLNQHVVIPGSRADVLVATFDISRREAKNATVKSGIALPLSAPSLANGDVVARLGPSESHDVTSAGTTFEGETFYEIDSEFSVNAAGPLFAYRATAYRSGTINNNHHDELTLALHDDDAKVGSWVLVDGFLHEIQSIDKTDDPWVATMTAAMSTNMGEYAHPLPTDGRTAAFMDLNPFTNGDWDAALLNQTTLVFPNAFPEEQHAKAFKVSGTHPDVVVMAEEFTVDPFGTPTFIADGTVGAWKRLLGDTSSNPDLSWEYWNGTGWWKLGIKLDETLNLKISGGVRFDVPNDIASGDWAGRTNFWVRARLIGGDYGKEQVTVITTPGPPNSSTQTIDRSSSGVRPPSVVQLRISYRLCKAVRPVFVLAQDSGAMRDQSDANRTAGAIVEAFVPLSVTRGRLSAGQGPSSGRALFIGLAATPSGAPVNVLLLVASEERHEQFAPMKIEALVADRFVPIVAEDTTRALGESGLLSMSFTVAPTPRELFGMDNLTWLRLTPAGTGVAKDWKPSLRGAYLNAVWASAAETLTRELLGSSDGAPNLVVRVARPPVLADSLELRVKEPLGEEERKALREKEPNRVASDVEGLPGDWVLWDRAIDPGDEPPSARVYALDESIGEIRFGDGQHGMIPPPGRDSIVAFAYRRTEIGGSESNDVPGNVVTARTALNLVSPVEGVEAVFAADRAAGGAPPENGERVVRFGTARLRHRGRAITARDFEDLALESSPDIVQARCFAGRGHARLVVVMRGEDPQPDAAEVRELKRLLLESASSSLSASDALRITGPGVRRLRIALTLRVATLDVAGDVARDVQKRIATLFDTTSWPLGTEPNEGEIALALLDTPALESLADVQLREVQADGEVPWTVGVKRHELVMLDKDAVRLAFETVEVFA